MPSWIGEAVKLVPTVVGAVKSIFEGSDESAEEPGGIARGFGKLAARVIPDAEEDDIADVLISLGEAGELLKAAGRGLKQANTPVDEGGS